jgi:hypothetical protein
MAACTRTQVLLHEDGVEVLHGSCVGTLELPQHVGVVAAQHHHGKAAALAHLGSSSDGA